MKTTAIEKYLKKHLSTCTMHRYSDGDNRKCSCGLDEARAELRAMKAERLAIARSIKSTVNGEAPDNLVQCVEYMMLQEYYPAQENIERQYREIKALKEQLAAKDAMLAKALVAMRCNTDQQEAREYAATVYELIEAALKESEQE